ncbi:hypothetical protein M9H77_33824 [Catharanthus roseus]|uniref:Uncharacterized protein n=1 Tax=Catharanthus roseus TaxID=4058 RepID=A0ACB9ZL49_CATRO|nr:hypothetical protein M9H77_33824 [Catharanthus roseus]
MERLVYSNPLPSKLHLRHTPFLPRLPRLSSFSFPSRRVNSISCSYQDPISSSLTFSKKSIEVIEDSKQNSSSLGDLSNGSGGTVHSLTKFVESCTQKQKVVAAGSLILLSAIIVTLVHPIVALPAFAFQATASAGGAAVGSRLLRSELLTSAWTGFFAGCLHTLSGPDHLAALAPLSIGRSRLESAAVGALWGCGHDAGQVIFGLLFLLLKDRLHIEIIRTWGTRVVGFTLLVIGAMGIREASEVPAPCVALENGECDVSVYEGLENPAIGKKKIGFATFATGIVHGLQPDALMMILPALALPSRLAGAAFLLMFLVGTVIAMGSYTVLIGSCSQALKERIPRITEKLTWASSLVAIGLGLAILISQFFGFSLY